MVLVRSMCLGSGASRAPIRVQGGRLALRRSSSTPSSRTVRPLRPRAEYNFDAGGQPGGGGGESQQRLKAKPVRAKDDELLKEKAPSTSSPMPAPVNPNFSSPLLRAPLSGGLEWNIRHHLELPDAHVSARNLMEHAMYGDLVTKMSPMEHRRAGWPVASIVDFANNAEGTPIFSLSPMAMHTRNVNADPRCSLVVEMPGWRGLSSARVTLFGTVKKVPDEMQDMARALFQSKHPAEVGSYGTSQFTMFALADIVDVYFVGGYGTVEWVNVKDYLSCTPNRICDRRFADPLAQINKANDFFREAIPKIFKGCSKGKIIGIDSGGIDLRLQLGDEGHLVLQRVRFHEPAGNFEEVKAQVAKILEIGFKSNSPCTAWKCE